MAGLRFPELQSRPMEFLDFTSLTLDEFQGYALKAGHPLEGSCQEGKHPPYTPFCIFLPRYVAWHLAADLPFRPHPCLQQL
jgi:hypothetical protein